MKNEIQIIKLMNGETIIADANFDSKKPGTIIINDPMLLVSLIHPSDPEVSGISMHRWVPFYNGDLHIKKSLVITHCKAPKELESFYLSAKERISLNPDIVDDSAIFLKDYDGNGIKQ
jgi:hypothetical protein